MPNIQAIIFDMDGVLLDSEPLHQAAMNAVLAREGQRVDDAEYRTYIGDSAEQAWRAIVARRGLAGPLPEYLAAYDDAVCAVVAAQGVPMPGLLALLAHLRQAGVPLAVASSSPRRWIDASLARIGVRDYFTAIVSGEMVARHKPAPDSFRRAAALLGVAPAGCLAIEDSPRGFQAARAAGMFVVALVPAPAAADRAADADLVVPSLRVFLDWWLATQGGVGHA
ncbi:MAG TPA: HAD family phosphatase [Chloroflexia bacterium]|nr:HAD family phosphatase [Chloroflexia bacterium]